MSSKAEFPFFSGAVLLEQILLSNFSRTKDYDITFIVQELNIYESITNNTLCADILISDGVELVNRLPIIGEEFVTFSIQTPQREKLNFEFFVESISPVTQSETATMKFYRLRCVTFDFLKNSFTLASKRFTDFDYDSAVQQTIAIDLGSSKPLKIEKTKGKFDYVVNNVRPLQVIDLIKERAVSAERNQSSIFFFYEDHHRYNFVTLEKLIEERKSKANNFKYNYSVSVLTEDFEKRSHFRNILYYQINNMGSAIDKVRGGRVRNQIREFNILNGTYYDTYEYVNSSDYVDFKMIDNQNVDFNTKSFGSTVEAGPGRIDMVVKDGLRPEMEHNKNIHYKRAYEERLVQYGLSIRVYGDTNMLLGDVIELDMPDIVGTTGDKEPHIQKNHSGKYLVFKQRHMLYRDGNDNYFKHLMELDLRKLNFLNIDGEG